MKNAPTPWKKDGDKIVDKHGEAVCRMVGDPTRESNADLITAASDLLDACHEAKGFIISLLKIDTRQVIRREKVLKQIFAAIAKSEGRP
jgi:hypothetical protein